MPPAGVEIFCAKVASGLLRWKTTSWSLGVSTRSTLSNSEAGPFLKLMLRTRSMENFTSLAVRSWPLENFRPSRIVQRNCSFLRSPNQHLEAASGTGSVPERGSRSSVWKVLRSTVRPAMSYTSAGSKGAGVSFDSSNRSVLPMTMAPPSLPAPSDPPQATSTGARRPTTVGSTSVLRFIVGALPAIDPGTIPTSGALATGSVVKFSRRH